MRFSAYPDPRWARNWYRYSVYAVEDGPLRAEGGLSVKPDHGPEALEEAGLIIISGRRAIDAPVPDTLCAALHRAADRGVRIMSLCSGVAVLAAAGLLDGRCATTHWRYLEGIARRYPRIRFVSDVLDVDEGTILTAAGSAAGFDLCLHVVRGDFGPAAAPSHRRSGPVRADARPRLADGGAVAHRDKPAGEPDPRGA